MRSEDDLRDTLADLAAEMPDAADLRLDRPGPSRRLLVAGVAAALVLLVGGGIAVATRPGPTVSGRPADPTGWGYDLEVRPPAGWSVDASQLVRGGIQIASVSRPATGSDGEPCLLTVGVGASAPEPLTGSSAVDLDGRPALLGRGSPYRGAAADNQAHLRWNPAEGRWADSTCLGDDAEASGARQLARSLRLAPSRLAVPFLVPALPLGLALQDVVRQPRAGSTASRVYADLVTRTDVGAPSGNPSGHNGPSVFLVLETVAEHGSRPATARRLGDLDGRRVWTYRTPGEDATNPTVEGHTLDVLDGDHVISLSSQGLTLDQLLELTRSISLARDLGQERTWYDSTELTG